MRRYVNAQGDIAKVIRTRKKPYNWKNPMSERYSTSTLSVTGLKKPYDT